MLRGVCRMLRDPVCGWVAPAGGTGGCFFLWLLVVGCWFIAVIAVDVDFVGILA